jgi:hypothetical protein
MNEAPTNNQPINQAALVWLKRAKASPQVCVNYLAQFAEWGLEKDVVNVPRPMSPSQPERHNVESAVSALLEAGPRQAAFATNWFLSNPNLPKEKQAQNLVRLLNQAKDPSDAAQVVVETAYDLMVAGSATSPE